MDTTTPQSRRKYIFLFHYYIHYSLRHGNIKRILFFISLLPSLRCNQVNIIMIIVLLRSLHPDHEKILFSYHHCLERSAVMRKKSFFISLPCSVSHFQEEKDYLFFMTALSTLCHGHDNKKIIFIVTLRWIHQDYEKNTCRDQEKDIVFHSDHCRKCLFPSSDYTRFATDLLIKCPQHTIYLKFV